MEQILSVVFPITVVLFSAIIHEIAHGAIALRLGDPTAKYAGRLTLNPVRHLDPFGSIILPLVLVLLGATPFGWAKPVPYNPYNFKDARKGSLAVGLAGPLTNFFVAGVFAATIRLMVVFGSEGAGGGALVAAFFSIMLINLILGIFNLLPIPPLDGSKGLFYLFPWLEPIFMRIGPYILLFLIFLIAPMIIEPIIRLGLGLMLDLKTATAITPYLQEFRYLF